MFKNISLFALAFAVVGLTGCETEGDTTEIDATTTEEVAPETEVIDDMEAAGEEAMDDMEAAGEEAMGEMEAAGEEAAAEVDAAGEEAAAEVDAAVDGQ